MPYDRRYIGLAGGTADHDWPAAGGCGIPMTLTCDTVLTACNEFLPGQQGEVFFQKGYVLVMMCQDSFTVS